MQVSTINFTNPTSPYVTTDNTPQNVVLFEVTEHSSCMGRLSIVARRPSDGASKAWDISALVKRDNNVVTNLGSVGGAAPFGASLDLTALLLCTIAFFTNGNDTGVTITGLTGSEIHWGLSFDGIQVVD